MYGEDNPVFFIAPISICSTKKTIQSIKTENRKKIILLLIKKQLENLNAMTFCN